MRNILQLLKDRVEHKQKDHWTDRVTLENTTFEWKLTRSPFAGLHHCTGMSVKSVEILSNHWWDEVAFKCEINQ